MAQCLHGAHVCASRRRHWTMSATLTDWRNRTLIATSVLVLAILAVLGGTRTRASADVPTPPGNDNLAQAEVLTGASGRINQDADGATVQLGEPAIAGQHTVWFKWTAPSTAPANFGVSGQCADDVDWYSWFEHGIHAYTGTNFNNFQPI